jgi:hypothetical protein
MARIGVVAMRVVRDAATEEIQRETAASKAIILKDDGEDEVVETTAIKVVGIVWAPIRKRFQVQLALGHFGDDGKFVRNEKYEVAMVSWNRDDPDQRKLWEKHNIEDLEDISSDTIIPIIHAEGMIDAVGTLVWKIANFEAKLIVGDEVLSDYSRSIAAAIKKPIKPIQVQ